MSTLTLSSQTKMTQVSSKAPPAVATSADRASATVWIAILAAMIGAFMAILNIQITNASLLDIEGGAPIELRPGMSVIPTIETMSRKGNAETPLAASRVAYANSQR